MIKSEIFDYKDVHPVQFPTESMVNYIKVEKCDDSIFLSFFYFPAIIFFGIMKAKTSILHTFEDRIIFSEKKHIIIYIYFQKMSGTTVCIQWMENSYTTAFSYNIFMPVKTCIFQDCIFHTSFSTYKTYLVRFKWSFNKLLERYSVGDQIFCRANSLLRFLIFLCILIKY